MRINKYLAKCGICSRRGADELILKGEVMIDGKVASLGDEVSSGMKVTVSGREILLPDETIVMAYYKPVGVTCSEKDPHADRLVIDEISSERRLTYAGRLDRDSEGLLIMTDDGDLIDAMMRGSHFHEKEYEVRVNKIISDIELEKLASGIYLEELDTTTRPCRVVRTSGSSFTMVLTQGLNRQIRRMCESLGYKVEQLKRTRVMNVTLGDLQVGASRILAPEEKKTLYSECGLHI
ncbi:23S rRNA pseudouridine2604 synthase [Lachnospiraceae bacterium XBB2008]|nr:23S rRNA pseudouridine2604 synthase [Lachnospiraceae bacterium XBB2008]